MIASSDITLEFLPFPTARPSWLRKQTARMSTGGKAPMKILPQKTTKPAEADSQPLPLFNDDVVKKEVTDIESKKKKTTEPAELDTRALPLFQLDELDRVKREEVTPKKTLKQTARMSTGGKAPRKFLPKKTTGGMMPRKQLVNRSAIRTPPAAANSAEKRKTNDERMTDIESKKKKTTEPADEDVEAEDSWERREESISDDDVEAENSKITEARVGRVVRFSGMVTSNARNPYTIRTTGAMAPRKHVNRSAIRTPSAAANSAEKRKANDERITDIESKKKKTTEADKSQDVRREASALHGGNGSSLMSAAASAPTAGLDDNDVIIIDSRRNDDSILDGVPGKWHMMSRARREAACVGRSEEEKIKLILHLQDANREMAIKQKNTEKALGESLARVRKMEEEEKKINLILHLQDKNREMAIKQKNTEKLLDESLARVRRMKRDIEEFFGLSNSDRQRVENVVVRADNKTAALAAEMAAIRDHQEME